MVTAGSNGGGFDVARTLLAGAEKSPRETNPRADARAFGHRAPRLDEDEMFVVHARVVARRGTGGRVPDAPGAGNGDVHERELTPEGVSTSHDALSAHLLAQNLRGGGGGGKGWGERRRAAERLREREGWGGEAGVAGTSVGVAHLLGVAVIRRGLRIRERGERRQSPARSPRAVRLVVGAEARESSRRVRETTTTLATNPPESTRRARHHARHHAGLRDPRRERRRATHRHPPRRIPRPRQ